MTYVEWMISAIEQDPKALKRGIDRVTVHPDDCRLLGYPTCLHLASGTAPIYPTGRQQGRFHWYYKKHKR